MFRYQVLIFLASSVIAVIVSAMPSDVRFQTVEKLLTISSAAMRVEKSGNQDARRQQSEALGLLKKARNAAADGDGEKADKLLSRATKMMFDATRLVEKDDASIRKDLRDFDTREASIDALCAAYHNIREEKGLGDPESSELYPFVQKRLSMARRMKEAGRLREGRVVLDEAYVAAKVAIEHLRGGETLVRALKFKSAEEEYHYEIDRNDTHDMLIKVLLRDKIDASVNLRSMVENYMSRAKVLRHEADRKAESGEYEDAIGKLEESTKEIVRAIRSAGIYIPG